MSEYVEVQMILITEYGEYIGRKVNITTEQYKNFIKMSKSFYSSGFELTCEDGSYMVFAPEVVSKSILKINKRIISHEDNSSQNTGLDSILENPSQND